MVWSQILDGWEAKLKGDTKDTDQRFEAAKELAAARGFRYLPDNRLADNLEQVVARYRGSSSGLSAVVNKYLPNNGLLETPKHTLYGLRHSLLAAGVDERIRRDLMGHALNRERYGKGASLQHLQEIVQTTAL